MSTSDRRSPSWLLPAGLAVVVVALVAIALMRGPVTLDPDTAEGAVQEYLLALSEERWDDAIEVLHRDWRGECEGSDISAFAPRDFTAQLGSPDGLGGFAVSQSFSGVAGEGVATAPTMPEETTQVEVTISRDEGAGLGSQWNESVVFELTDDGEFWWIVGDPWPYFVWNCRGI